MHPLLFVLLFLLPAFLSCSSSQILDDGQVNPDNVWVETAAPEDVTPTPPSDIAGVPSSWPDQLGGLSLRDQGCGLLSGTVKAYGEVLGDGELDSRICVWVGRPDLPFFEYRCLDATLPQVWTDFQLEFWWTPDEGQGVSCVFCAGESSVTPCYTLG